MDTIIAAAAGLLGTLVGGLAQWAAARAARAEAARTARHSAVATLVAALADHRRAMWVREDARMRGADPAQLTALRAASHATRSAVTVPLTTLCLLAPDLGPTARAATTAAYALRDAPSPAALNRLRDTALAATDHLVDTAAH